MLAVGDPKVFPPDRTPDEVCTWAPVGSRCPEPVVAIVGLTPICAKHAANLQMTFNDKGKPVIQFVGEVPADPAQ